MLNNLKIDFETRSREATISLAASLGARFIGGEVIELLSDLGGGKTTFAKGLVQGIGSKDIVSSPSFTISQEYKAKDRIIHHLDFYRLQEPGIMQNELDEMIKDKSAITIIEWGEIVEGILPSERLVVRLRATDINTRKISIEYPTSYTYLFEESLV